MAATVTGAWLAGAGGVAGQATATVVGRVLDADTHQPLPNAQVFIGGTQRGSLTNADGRFVIERVPAGPQAVKVTLLGYADRSRVVTVPTSGSISVEFELGQAAVELNAVIVTGTPGATQKRAIGNSVASIQVSDVTAKAPISNVTQVLSARTPGLTIMQGSGTPGTASNIRIRGISSINASNQPVFYIDGVRMMAGSQGGFSTGGQSTSALDAVNPEDIESIEVIKGPAAATLYGAEAAAGVIQIITKKGSRGAQSLQWTAKVETGSTSWALDMPTNYTLCSAARIRSASYPGCAGMDSTAAPAARILSQQPLKDILRNGAARTYDVTLRGGAERYSFYMSGQRDGEDGIFPNSYFKRTTGRANFTATPLDRVDVTATVSYTRSYTRLPNNDNSSNGWLRNAFRGYPGYFPSSAWALGWRGLGPDQMDMYNNLTRAERFIMGSTVKYEPFPWFKNRLTGGLDAGTRLATLFYTIDRTGRAPYGATAAQGYIDQYQPQTRNWTLDYAGTLSRRLTRSIDSDLSFGMQYNAYRFESLESWGWGLLSDSTQLVSAASNTQGAQSYSERRSLGFFAQEQVGYANRIFVTGALRMDNNSVFGSAINRVFYPKLSTSWVISEERWFHLPAVDNLRLRAAWGQAGSAPDPFAADRNYAAGSMVAQDGTILPVLRASSYGNPNLKAERGNEIELGFESSLLNGRAGVDFTYYNKTTRDALIGIPLAPSGGFTSTLLSNIGKLNNMGAEMTLTGAPIRTPKLAWDARLSVSLNRNRFITFNGARTTPIEQGYAGPDGVATQRIAEGYSMAGYWARQPLKNPDGSWKFDATGRPILADTAVYMGPSTPTREGALANTFTFFRNFRLYVLADYKGGHKLFNMTQQTRDADGNSWEAVNPAADTIAFKVRRYSTPQYIEAADFVKLREVSLTFTLPRTLAERAHARSMDLTVGGRNLAIWTKYSGPDPEVNIDGDANFTRGDYMSVPMLRRFVTTLNVNF